MALGNVIKGFPVPTVEWVSRIPTSPKVAEAKVNVSPLFTFWSVPTVSVGFTLLTTIWKEPSARHREIVDHSDLDHERTILVNN